MGCECLKKRRQVIINKKKLSQKKLDKYLYLELSENGSTEYDSNESNLQLEIDETFKRRDNIIEVLKEGNETKIEEKEEDEDLSETSGEEKSEKDIKLLVRNENEEFEEKNNKKSKNKDLLLINENDNNDSDKKGGKNIVSINLDGSLDEKNVIDKIKNNLMPYEIVLKDYLDKTIDGNEVFEKKWYSDIEKDKIIYSKRSIIAMINAAFEDKDKKYTELYNKEPLKIYLNRDGSLITDQFHIIRSCYKVNKNIYPPNITIRTISKYLNFVKERSSWDKQLKSYKVIEGNEEGKEVKCVVQNWTKSPMIFVSERDIIDKRFEFYHNKKYYCFESSVNDDYYPLDESVTRMNEFIFIEELYEENDYIILKAITQIDTKVSLPQYLMNSTFPAKLLSFYNDLANALNNDYKEGKLVMENNIY